MRYASADSSQIHDIEVRFLDVNPVALGQFVELYQSRIDPEDQVEPEYILQWLSQPKRSARTPEDFIRIVKAGKVATCHILLGAYQQGALVGFANVVYLLGSRVGFVAYLAATAPGAAKKLVGYLHEFGQQMSPKWKWIVFELSHTDKQRTRVRARRRIFAKYLHEIGCRASRVEMPYRVPALAPGQERFAELIVAEPSSNAQRGLIDRKSYLEIVRAIYFEVYADSMALGGGASAYRYALERELESAMSRLPSQIRLTAEVKGLGEGASHAI